MVFGFFWPADEAVRVKECANPRGERRKRPSSSAHAIHHKVRAVPCRDEKAAGAIIQELQELQVLRELPRKVRLSHLGASLAFLACRWARACASEGLDALCRRPGAAGGVTR